MPIRYLTSIFIFVLASCTAVSPPSVPTSVPKAKLWVAAQSESITNIEFARVPEKKCEATKEYQLGFFHPSVSASGWQKERRLLGARQELSVPATVPENMYANM